MVPEKMIREIVNHVIEEMRKRSILPEVLSEVSANFLKQAVNEAGEVKNSDLINVPPRDEVLVPQPRNPEALPRMKQLTPARIGVWRAGTRPLTETLIRFRADHAMAQDMVVTEVPESFIQSIGALEIYTCAETKDQFLTCPDTGRRLSEEGRKLVREQCVQNPRVQVIISDGLSSGAVEANIPDFLPPLMNGLADGDVKCGTLVFVRHGRVGIMDDLGGEVGAELAINLIGERPGLVTAKSLSAYILYRPRRGVIEAERTVVSNIHAGGTPAVEAGAHIATLILQMLQSKASGINFRF